MHPENKNQDLGNNNQAWVFWIFSKILKKIALKWLMPDDVIRGIEVRRVISECHNGIYEDVGFFDRCDNYPQTYGRIFPLSEILESGQIVDVIVKNPG